MAPRLRQEPYNPDARDADGDGIVQEGTPWERPAGTRIVNRSGNPIRSGLNYDEPYEGIKYVDADGNEVAYKPTWSDEEEPTLGETLGAPRAPSTPLGDFGLPTLSEQGLPTVRDISKPSPPEKPEKPKAEKKKVKKPEKLDPTGALPGFTDDSTDRPDLVEPERPRRPFEPPSPPLDGVAYKYALDARGDFREFVKILDKEGYVVIDYETTGLDVENVPVQVGLVRVKNGKVVERLNLFMNPESPLSEWSAANLRDADGKPITTAWLATQPSVAEVHQKVVDFIGDSALMAHNIRFDREVLERTLRNENIDYKVAGHVDTLSLLRETIPKGDGKTGPERHTLEKLTQFFGVELGDAAHTADADAEATHELFRAAIPKVAESEKVPDIFDAEKQQNILDAATEKYERNKKIYAQQMKEYEAALAEYQRAIVKGIESESQTVDTEEVSVPPAPEPPRPVEIVGDSKPISEDYDDEAVDMWLVRFRGQPDVGDFVNWVEESLAESGDEWRDVEIKTVSGETIAVTRRLSNAEENWIDSDDKKMNLANVLARRLSARGVKAPRQRIFIDPETGRLWARTMPRMSDDIPEKYVEISPDDPNIDQYLLESEVGAFVSQWASGAWSDGSTRSQHDLNERWDLGVGEINDRIRQNIGPLDEFEVAAIEEMWRLTQENFERDGIESVPLLRGVRLFPSGENDTPLEKALALSMLGINDEVVKDLAVQLMTADPDDHDAVLRDFIDSRVRGAGFAGEIDDVPLSLTSLSSWSTDPGIAEEFSDEAGSSGARVVLRSSVPASRILSTPASGYGCLAESEMVVIGSSDARGSVKWERGDILPEDITTMANGVVAELLGGEGLDGVDGFAADVLGADEAERIREEAFEARRLLDEEDEVERFASTPVAANGERLGYVPGEPSGDEMVEIHRANREAKISTAEATLSGLVDSVVGGFDAAEALLDAGLSREEAQSQISEEAVSRALIALQDAQESRTVYISTGPEGLAGIVDDGRYKSQFETGTSAGWYDPDLRARYEEEGLGVPFSLDDALRPVYGFVIDSSDTDPSVSNAANYGGAIIEIGRERVADRSTVTLDDSLNMGATGVPMNRPKDEVSREDALASLGGSDLWADFVISAAVSFFEDLEEDDIADELRGRYLDQEDRPYQEVQIHGGVGRDDIDRILVADFDFFEEGTLDKLVESGIKVTDRNGDSWSPSEAVPDNNTPKVPVITLADLPPTSELGESGDGMLTLPNGRRLWGRFGAAGLLVRHTDSDGNVRYFMQKRGEDVQLAGTWSVPGGAIYELETADDGAVREFVEEAGSLPVGRVVGRHVAEQGDGAWAYTTVIYEVDEQFEPDENWESAGGRWLTADEVAELDLHPGFASAWPVLRDGGDDAGSESPESDGVGEVRSYSPAPNRMNPLEPGNTDELVREVDNERGDHEPKAGSIDKALDLIVVKQGFDGLPGLVDSVDDLPEGQPVFYRGVTDTSDESAEDLVDQFAHGDFFVGTGMFGNGIYGSTEEEMALSYATGNSMVANPDGVITFALRPDAKVADWDELVEARKLVDSNSDVAKDPGRVAAILGYDAVIKPVVSATGETQEQILILLNRSAAVVVDPRKKPANNKTAKTRLAGAGAVLNYITENADALSEETPGTPGDWMLNNIYSQQGFDQILPSVVETPDDLPEGTRLFRGIGASKSAFRESVTPDLYDEAVEKVDQFRNGTHYPGTGIIGSGSYFSVDRDDAEDYMHPEDRPWGTTPKTLIFGSLSPDARIADWDDIATVIPILKNELEARRLQVRGDKERARIDFLARLINDPGRVAALMGYDGMQEPTLYRDDDSPIPTRHVVLFNRGVLTVSKVGAPRAPSTRPGVALLRARGLDPDPF